MSWAETALCRMLDQVAATEPTLPDRWPLYADPVSGEWTTTGRGSWTGGFWAGLLWLRAAVTGHHADRAAARRRTEMLTPWADADTATRGLILWYATCLGGPDTAVARAAAATACLAAYDSQLGLVPWGAAFGGPRELARVDGAPGLVPLLREAGPDGDRAARAHLDTQVGLCTGTPELRPAWRRSLDGGWAPHPVPPPGWSRTVGWLCLAVADGDVPLIRRCLGHPVVAARLAGDAPAVPTAGGGAGGTRAVLPDTSAAAIEAVAALKLADRLAGPEGGRLRDRGAAVLRALADGHVRAGRLVDGCYDPEEGVAESHELVWGDFFLALGLATLAGVIAPSAY